MHIIEYLTVPMPSHPPWNLSNVLQLNLSYICTFGFTSALFTVIKLRSQQVVCQQRYVLYIQMDSSYS